MSMYFQNRYRISSIRLKQWDYSQSGYYFVTICTKNKQPYFGYIKNGFVCLSHIGKIVYDEWVRTQYIRKNISVDTFVIMPDHMHGIIRIIHPIVETHCNASLQNGNNNLSNIIRGYKSKSTTLIHQMGYYNFAWQPRFYEHVIRNEDDLHRIRRYIYLNPNKG